MELSRGKIWKIVCGLMAATEEEMAAVLRGMKPFCPDLIMSDCIAVSVLLSMAAIAKALALPHGRCQLLLRETEDSKEDRKITLISLLCLLPAVLFLPFAK